jgi:hypothetical protein
MFINPDNQYHRGDVRPSDGKLFWAYLSSKRLDGTKRRSEYWVTPERFKLLDIKCAEHRSKPESRARQNKYCSEWGKINRKKITEVRAKRRQKPEVKERLRQYYRDYRANPENQEKFALWRTKYKRDPETAARRKKRLEKYYANPEVKNRISANRRKRENARRLEDPAFLIKKRTNCRVRKALRSVNAKKSHRTVDLIGCSYAFLKEHIEKQFKEEMSWGKINSFHLDHIRPLSSFDLTNTEQLKAAFHWTNLQPLTPEENMKKRDRLDWCHSENIAFDSTGYGC